MLEVELDLNRFHLGCCIFSLTLEEIEAVPVDVLPKELFEKSGISSMQASFVEPSKDVVFQKHRQACLRI